MKKKIILKRLLCGVMIAVMMLSCIGCGGGDGGKKVLKFVVSHVEQKDTDVVEKALNKKLETLLPGVQIDLIAVDSQQFTMWMSAGTQIDIGWSGYMYDMAEQTRMGAYKPLDDLIEKYAPNIKKEMETYKLDYDTGRYEDGKLYAIPNQQPFVEETPHLIIPAETIKYFDIDGFLAEMKKSPYTTRETYEIFDRYLSAVKANNATDTDFVGKYMNMNYIKALIAYRGYYMLTGSYIGYKIWNEDGSMVEEPKYENMLETDAFKLWMEYAIKWQKAGYLQPTTADSGLAGTQLPLISAHTSGNWFGFDGPDDDESRGMKAVYDNYGNITSYTINIEPRDYSHSYYDGGVYGAEKTYMVIPKTAKYPEEAIKLLDLMRAPVGEPGNDFLNMLVYGFEKDSDEAKESGVYHYTLNGDQIHSDEYVQQATAATSYGQPHWSVGNVYLTYRTELIYDGMNEYGLKYDTETRMNFPVLPTAGLILDNTEIKSQLESITSTSAEYGFRVDIAIEKDGTKALYDEYMKKLKTAGIDEVIKNYEKQYKEFKK